jgi:hypothetical protein
MLSRFICLACICIVAIVCLRQIPRLASPSSDISRSSACAILTHQRLPPSNSASLPTGLYCNGAVDTCKLSIDRDGKSITTGIILDNAFSSVLLSPDRNSAIIATKTQLFLYSVKERSFRTLVSIPNEFEFGVYDDFPSFVSIVTWETNTLIRAYYFKQNTQDNLVCGENNDGVPMHTRSILIEL